MVLLPNILEARAALDKDTSRRHDERELQPRQLVGDLISIIVSGLPDEETTTGRPTTTGRGQTNTRTSPTPTNTNTRTRTSATSTSQTATRSNVVTSPPAVSSPTTTITRTSTQPLSTGNANNSVSEDSQPKTGLPSVVVGVIVAASVIFGLIIIALIVRKFFQLRRRRRRGTWARGSVIAPFEPPLQEKALPPPPAPMAAASQNRSYPAYPPTAVTFANNGAPYSPAAPSSAGYPTSYPFGGNNVGVGTGTTAAGMFNQSAYTPNDLTGPIVITPPTPSITAAAGTISIVKRTFVPSLPDELSIANGDQVRVLSVYDDGWALCEKVVGGEKGVVPQECLESVQVSNSNAPQQQTAGNEETRLNRNSSLRRGQDQTY